MTLYELWEISQSMVELGLNPIWPWGITREILAGNMPFSKLEDSIREWKNKPIGQLKEE